MIKKGELYFPSAKTKEKAILRDEKIYQEAERDPVAFWSKLAKELFWFKEWEKDFEENPPYFKWFLDCLLYTSPSPRDISGSRMPSSA